MHGTYALRGLDVKARASKISGEITGQNADKEVAAIMGESVKFRRGYATYASSHGVLSTYIFMLVPGQLRGLGCIAGILSLEVRNEKS